MAIPEFGNRLPGKEYTRRPGAYAIIFDAVGAVALVCHEGCYYLPGGGIEGAETPEAALERELAEETGWTAEILADLGRADEHHQDEEGHGWTKAGHFFLARVSGRSPVARERGHDVVWLPLADALPRMTHPSQAWAVRRGGGGQDGLDSLPPGYMAGTPVLTPSPGSTRGPEFR